MKNKLLKMGTIVTIATPIIGVVSCVEKNNSKVEIVKPYSTQFKIEEQLKINAITIQNMKNNDGLNWLINTKIALPSSSTSIKTSIEKYVNSLLLGWIVTINPFTPDAIGGGLDYKVVLSKVGYTAKIINISYIDGSFKTRAELEEQSKIDAITTQNLKDNDKLNSPVNTKIAIPTSSFSIKTSIEKYVNSLNKILGWIVTISLFNPRQTSGGLDYTVVLSKVGYISKRIYVSYIDGSFKTTAELEQQSKINAITIQNIKDNDGLNSPTNAKITPPTNFTSIKASIGTYVNGLNWLSGWNIAISAFTPDAIRGGLDYTIVLSKEKYISKIINVSYINGSFKTTAEELMAKEREKLIVILKNAKANDGLNPYINKIAPPTSSASIKTLIEKYVNGLNKFSGWNIAINEFTPDAIGGSLDYKIVLSKVGYTRILFLITYIDGSFRTTVELAEQSKIDAIDSTNIKAHDGLNSKIIHPTHRYDAKILIKKYVNGLNGVSGWEALFDPFTFRQESGGLDYTIVLSKVGYISKRIYVSYIDGSFKTRAELEEQSKINAITTQNIKDNDGINSPADAKIIIPTSFTLIQTLIETYVNDLNGVSGWTIIIDNFKPYTEISALIYEVFLSKVGYKSKRISVSYDPKVKPFF